MRQFKTYSPDRSFAALLLITAILLSLPGNSIAQPDQKDLRSETRQLFFLDPIVFYSKEKSQARVDVYMEVPLENLQFKKNYTTKKYDASISYTINIRNFAGEMTESETVTDYVTTTKEEQKSLEGSSKIIVAEYYLNPGKYDIEVTLTDLNTKKELILKDKLAVADFLNRNLTFSGIMMISSMAVENGKKVITPLINRNVDNLNEFFVFFEVYNAKNENIINSYSYQITDGKERIVERGNFNYTFTPGVNKCFEKIKSANLVYGDYILEVKDNGSGELEADKRFSSKMTGFPLNTKDLDLMIDQLLYIATDDQLSKIKAAKTTEQKQKQFVEFWKSKDPSPKTSRNELMIEYYRRIQLANERYSHFIDGWKTDMGMVYVIFGEPDNIERYPFQENSKPFEVWYYYNENREFEFVDESGFGDYRLTTPIWDVDRTRIRN